MVRPWMAAAAAAVLGWTAAAAQESKQGGVAFRFDDNKSAGQWSRMAEVFGKYDFPMSLAVSFGKPIEPAALEVLRRLPQRGHEIMDHTPSHLGFVIEAADAGKYAAEPGVDHLSNNRVCLKYRVRKDASGGRFTADVEGNLIRPSDPEAVKKLKQEWTVYLPALDRALLARPEPEAGVFRLTTIWGEPVPELAGRKGMEFVILNNWRGDRAGVTLDPAALALLLRVSREAAGHAGLPSPTTWIQPGSLEPMLRAEDIGPALRAAGLTSAATYPGSALKTYCEPQPERCRYAMQWGEFRLEDDTPLEVIKKKIADGVAKHYVLTGAGHMWVDKVTGGFEGYLARHDALLKWCRDAGIPVRTQRDWAERLYGAAADPAENIFPPFSVDRDRDGTPDGFILGETAVVTPAGLTIPGKGPFFRIDGLGGVEKGKNVLKYQQVKGELRTVIRFFRKGGVFGEPVEFTGNQIEFNVPAEAAALNIECFSEGASGAAVGGAELRSAGR